MRTSYFSLLCRLTAGALLFQATAPAGFAAKQVVDAALVRRQVDREARAAALVPPKPMKGVPAVKVTPAVPAPPIVARKAEPSLGSYLNEVARRAGGIDPARVADWTRELAKPGVAAERRAWLQLWIGESRLAVEEPDDAEGWLARASALGKGGPVEGIAAFDLAAARFYEGRYQEAGHELRALLKSRKRGYERKDAALLMRHAALCEGYHDAHERLGVPQPPRLDPLCGVASVAVCLRALGLPYGRGAMVAGVPHHGMGSSLDDLVRATRHLGLSAHVLSVRRDAGLIALPKPLVAHVEHDHFVAVVDADAKGVEYVCSDCGPWPGGPVRLTWKQWNALETDVYLAASRPGSVADLALVALEQGRSSKDVGLIASRTTPSLAAVRQGAAVRNLLASIEAAVVAQTADPGHPTVTCGQHPDSGKCVPGAIDAFFQSIGMGSQIASTAGDPTNLATAEEIYTPPADLTVYNPTGPSVSWGHVYGSLSRYSSGFGEGWTHPYSRGVEVTSSSGSLAGNVVFADGALMAFSGAKPTVAAPHVVCTLGAGMPYLLSADYDATTTGCTFTLTDESRTQWTTLAVGYPNDFVRGGTLYPLAKQTDRMGNWIRFVYSTYQPPWVGNYAHPTVYRLTEIDDSAGTALLTVGMDAQGWIVSASDRYGRSVYYQSSDHYGVFTNPNIAPTTQPYHHELDAVSQIVPTGASNPPARYQYGYNNGPSEPQEGVPYLGGVSVPSPTGSGMSGMGLYYDPNSGFLTHLMDANGKTTWFTYAFTGGAEQAGGSTGTLDGPGGGGTGGPPPFPGTTVAIKDGTTTIQQFGVVSDMNMSPTQLVDASGAAVWTKTYSDSHTPYRPSAVTDGNGRTWHYTWDKYNHLLTATSPKGTVTTCTYDYSHFALGELVSVQQGSKTATGVTYYEPSGLPQYVSAPIPGDVGTNSVQTTSYTYTAMGQLATVIQPGSGAGLTRTTTYGYTSDGTYSQAEALGEPIVVTDALGKKWHRRYDARGNFVERWDPLGNQMDVYLNLAGQVVTSAAPATGSTGSGRASTTTTYLYVGGPATQVVAKDESGSTVRTTGVAYGLEGETLSTSGSAETVSMTYDAAYRAKTLVDGNNHTTTYSYDLNGRPTETDYPLASGTNYDRVKFTSYDVVGNLLSRTDGNGQVANYAYADADGLLSGVTYPGATANNVSYTYDGYDRTTGATDGAGTSSSTYDDLGHKLASVRTYTGLPAKTFSYSYYPDGSRHTMVNPAGTWTYGYDGDGRYLSLVSPAGTSAAAYLDNGWQSSRTLPNGVSASYAYNQLGSLTGLLNQTSGASTISQYGSFTYDGAFNLTGVTASVSGATSQSGSTTFGYDSMDRLTSEASTRLGGYSQSNAYDAAGNPTTLRGAAQTFDLDNRQTGGTSFAYDGNGSPTTYRGSAMSYDPEARATAMGGLTAGYRADGLRAWKSYLGTKTYFLYDHGEPVVEMDGFGNITGTNVYAPDGLVARGTSSGWTQYAFDEEGNVAQRLSASGAVVTSSVYDGYGNGSTIGTMVDPFGYHAQQGYFLDETGLYLCRHRYYDPGTGRWVTRDPIGYDGGINLYGYCEGGPVGATDSSGLDPQKLPEFFPEMRPWPKNGGAGDNPQQGAWVFPGQRFWTKETRDRPASRWFAPTSTDLQSNGLSQERLDMPDVCRVATSTQAVWESTSAPVPDLPGYDGVGPVGRGGGRQSFAGEDVPTWSSIIDSGGGSEGDRPGGPSSTGPEGIPGGNPGGLNEGEGGSSFLTGGGMAPVGGGANGPGTPGNSSGGVE